MERTSDLAAEPDVPLGTRQHAAESLLRSRMEFAEGCAELIRHKPSRGAEFRVHLQVDVLFFNLEYRGNGAVGFGDDRPRGFEGRPDQIGFVPHGVLLKGVTTTARSQYMALLLDPAVRAALAEEAPGLQALPPLNHVSAGILRPIVDALEAEIRVPCFGPLYTGTAVRMLLLGLGGLHAGRRLIQHSCVALAGWRLRRVEEYVEAHLGEHITLEALAAVAGLSQSHFAHAFRRSTGHPPHRWLLRRRIERAKALLSERRMRLAEVALSLGFCDQAHFSTAFRRVTGITPAAWREHAAPLSTTSTLGWQD